MSRRLDQQGFALILALWALLLLSALGASVALAARQGAWLAGGHAQRAAARWAADAGAVSAEAQLRVWAAALAQVPAGPGRSGVAALDSASAAQRRVWLQRLNAVDSLLAGGRGAPLPNGAGYRVVARDATSRLNLNAAGEPELRRFFARWIVDQRELSIVVESLLDWRDEDDLVRANGAERGHYASLPKPHEPRDGPLRSARELLLIRGVTPELFHMVEPYVTVLATRHLRVNVNRAPAEVLAALPGFSPELAERLVARRRVAGPLLAASEIASDPELSAAFDRAQGARALEMIAVHPELLEVEAIGGSGDASHRVWTLYALQGAALQRLERREEAA